MKMTDMEAEPWDICADCAVSRQHHDKEGCTGFSTEQDLERIDREQREHLDMKEERESWW